MNNTMSIKRAAADEVIPGKLCAYNIGFINHNKKKDETQLDVSSLEELIALWNSLYKEFDCDEESILYVDLIGSLD